MEQKEWQKPKPIYWMRWLILYTICIAINKKYVVVIAEKLDLHLSSNWEIWLISTAPAIVFVTALLILRSIWYQLWLIYQQSNQYVYQEKVLSNQKYWSESLHIEDIIFECGQLHNETDLKNYLSLDNDARKKSTFELMSKKISLPDECLYSSRECAIAEKLVLSLKNKSLLNKDYTKNLWIWVGDRKSWDIFRNVAVKLSEYCPVLPDKYIKNSELNWIIDRANEGKYQKLLVLGIDYQQDCELILSLIFSNNGSRAKILRPLSLNRWEKQKKYFIRSINESISNFRFEHQLSDYTNIISYIKSNNIDCRFFKNQLPKFYYQLTNTKFWIHILLILYQLDSSAVMIQEEDILVPIVYQIKD